MYSYVRLGISAKTKSNETRLKLKLESLISCSESLSILPPARASTNCTSFYWWNKQTMLLFPSYYLNCFDIALYNLDSCLVRENVYVLVVLERMEIWNIWKPVILKAEITKFSMVRRMKRLENKIPCGGILMGVRGRHYVYPTWKTAYNLGLRLMKRWYISAFNTVINIFFIHSLLFDWT